MSKARGAKGRLHAVVGPQLDDELVNPRKVSVLRRDGSLMATRLWCCFDEDRLEFMSGHGGMSRRDIEQRGWRLIDGWHDEKPNATLKPPLAREERQDEKH